MYKKQRAIFFLMCVIVVGAVTPSRAEFPSTAYTGSPGAGAKALNPDVSLDGLFALSQFNVASPLTFEEGHDPHGNGVQLQNLELTLGASVDPYFRADANIVFNQSGEVEVEEAYATSLDFPWNLQLKAGAFFTGFGRLNAVHPHAWSFVNKPLVLSRMFGGDGLRNPGGQLSWLTSLPWYSEIIGSYQTSTGSTAVSFRGPKATMRSVGDGFFLMRSNNFTSISEELALNFGASWATGTNATGDRTRTNIIGGDLYLKYRRSSALSFVSLQIEALKRYYETPSQRFDDWGAYAELGWRVVAPFERWVLGARLDYVSDKPTPVATSGDPDRDTVKRWRVSPAVTFYPSEFSKIRLQYDHDVQDGAEKPQQMIALQFEYIIGAHGAHKF